jgi:hypothetical protein
MRNAIVWGVSMLWVLLALPAAFAQDPAGQTSDWRAEFDAVCSQTDASTSLTNEELAGLIARCDKLAERIGAEAEVVRRVFLKRLQSCRALLAFVLESRKSAPAALPADAAAPSPQTPATAPPENPATAPSEPATPPPDAGPH